jgi:hypothetical protein
MRDGKERIKRHALQTRAREVLDRIVLGTYFFEQDRKRSKLVMLILDEAGFEKKRLLGLRNRPLKRTLEDVICYF